MMNVQRGISVCGAEGQNCNTETDTLLPLPQQNWSRPYSHNFNAEASLNFDNEVCFQTVRPVLCSDLSYLGVSLRVFPILLR